MFDFMMFFNSFLPFFIESVDYDGDNLRISGSGWSFQCNSVWRISSDEKLIFTCWDSGSAERIKFLSGLAIVHAEWLSDRQKIDPSFFLRWKKARCVLFMLFRPMGFNHAK